MEFMFGIVVLELQNLEAVRKLLLFLWVMWRLQYF